MITPSEVLSSNVAKAAASTSTVSVIQQASTGTLEVSVTLYSSIAVVLGLIGVYLARLVTIDAENKRLGRVQTLRETGPLTWIGVLIVCPLIWHFAIAIPWASMIGLGVGYSVRIVLKVFGGGAVGWARAVARQAADALDDEDRPLGHPRYGDTTAPPNTLPQDQAKLLSRLDAVPDVTRTPTIENTPKKE